MNGNSHKLRVRIGASEFEAEGDEATVKEQYKMFLEALSQSLNQPTTQPIAAVPQDATTAIVGAPGEIAPSATSVSPLMDRVFSNTRGVISLRSLPQTKTRDADALLLLLYGYLKLKGEYTVFGTKLMKSARQSGLNIDRVDRVISEHKALYLRGGARRGATYSLNNQGETKAESIINSMFQ